MCKYQIPYLVMLESLTRNHMINLNIIQFLATVETTVLLVAVQGRDKFCSVRQLRLCQNMFQIFINIKRFDIICLFKCVLQQIPSR